jgi:CO dehydrogenase/acetyl-CoA synthase epsilon subunit
MRSTSISKFYTENIDRFFGFSPNEKITAFDSTLEGAVNAKWKTVHPDYLSSEEALVLGIKMFNEGQSGTSHSLKNIHEMFDYALSSSSKKSRDQQLFFLAMGIFYFSRALNEVKNTKQLKIMKLARYYMDESLRINAKCSLTRLHLTLVHVALSDIQSALRELVRMGRELNDEKIYKALFNIYENMKLPNIALFYSLKASKAKNILLS